MAAFRDSSIAVRRLRRPYAPSMVTRADVEQALRLPDGSLILERADSDDERVADEEQLGKAGWQVIARRERPGQTTVVTWAKTP